MAKIYDRFREFKLIKLKYKVEEGNIEKVNMVYRFSSKSLTWSYEFMLIDIEIDVKLWVCVNWHRN